jgi:PAS domain S-box-containing protein
LSGTGANGSMGLKRVKEMGGVAYVQNPREAEFNEMPRNAIATDLIDEVLPVAEIPGRIVAYRNSLGTVEIAVETESRPETQQQALREVFTQLRLRTGHDFSNYKRPTLLRRIERRINVRNLPDLPGYAAFLGQNQEESNALLKDLLISVTNFFRDKKPFEALERDVLPVLFRDKNVENELRIWVAGCATGEEAYSLAMLVAERTWGVTDAPKVQIFATDIDESAIAAAREGLYTLNDAADVSTERLQRFFKKEGDSYRVIREIREMILFAAHNFLKDPPFSRLDLVSCRNVLIYLNATAQERVMETFHFALKPGGFLFLGNSESVDGAGDLYATVSRENHIYQARQVAIRHYPVPESVPHPQPRQPLSVKFSEAENRQPGRFSFGELHQKLLEQYAPPSLVVNEEYDIVHMSEKAGGFLEFPGGEPTKNLLKLIKPGLRLELRSALYQAMQRQAPTEARNVAWTQHGEPQSVNIHVKPVTKEGDPAKGFMLVIFEPDQPAQGGETVVRTTDEPIARQLEEELTQVKAQLRLRAEQHEYQAEELKASNEELQAMNEELRSAAEELETSKEELQSINEELRTVNQELKVKIEEISTTSNNFQNLINSADVATIFLDRAFCTRLYTPAARHLFNLIPSDYGRPISDITHRLEYTDLLSDAQTVLEKLTAIEREVTTADGKAFMMRILPYRTSEDRINGVVITFFDITLRKRAEKALLQSEQSLRLLIESARDYAIYTLDTERRVVSWSGGAQGIFGYSEAEMIGKTGDILFAPEDRDQGIPEQEAERAATAGRAENERWHLRKDGSRFWASGLAQPLRDEGGNTIGFVKILRDLTEQKRAEAAKFFLASIVETSNDSVITIDFGRNITSWNKAAEGLYGYTAGEAIGKNLTMLTLPEDFPIILNYVDAIEHSREVAVFDTVRHKKDGQPIHLEIVMSPVLDTSGEVIGISTIARDVSERKRREANLAFLAKINLDFAPLLSVPEVMAPVGRQLADYLHLSGCLFSLVDEENDRVEVIYQYQPDQSLPGRMGFHRLAETFTEKGRRHLGAGKPAVISTTADSPMVQDSLHALVPLDLGSRVDVPHLEGGRWRFLLTVSRAQAGEWRSDELDLLEELATKIYIRIERARAEAAVRESEARLQLALDAADLSTFVWHIAEDRTEADARVLAHFGLPPDAESTLADALARIFHPEDGPLYVEAIGRAIDPAGSGTLHQEFRIRRPDGERWMSVIGKTVFEGSPPVAARIYGVLADITERKKAEEALQQSEERNSHLLLLTDTLRYINDPLQVLEEGLKRVGEYLDLDRVVYNEIDPEVTTCTTRVNYLKPGFSPVLGSLPMEPSKETVRNLQKGITCIQPDVESDDHLTEAEKGACRSIQVGAFVTVPLIRKNQWVCNLVAHSGKPRNWTAHELAIMEEAADRIWSAFERAKAEEALRQSQQALQQLNASLEKQVSERTQALRESRDMLQSVFDTTLLGLSILKAVRDEKGAITDFQILFINKELERETGRTDLVGKLYSAEYPGIRQVGLLDLMLRVMETGEPGQAEYYYPHQNLNKWYSSMFVKLGDGLAASNLDITERKLAEAELTRNFTILKQAEEVAGMGSWEYDVATGSFGWSEGMYRLFGLPVGSPVGLETYLDYVVAQDRPVAEKIIDTLRAGHEPPEEILRIGVNGEVVTLKIKATVLRDPAGKPVKMLGVDLDISRLKRLEEENIRMRLEQQQQLLHAILEAQEEERRRISESLHNGVGQLLYATKLNLVGVNLNASPEQQLQAAEALKRTEDLLTEAIVETRRVSHELVPVLLKDFGLQKAIAEFCSRFEQTGIRLECHCFSERLPALLETAVYRISQELVNNIVKHSGATRANLEVSKDQAFLYLDAQDNGKGMDVGSLGEPGAGKGIGFKTIRDRVALLNGTVEVDSGPGKGTLISIRLPLSKEP